MLAAGTGKSNLGGHPRLWRTDFSLKKSQHALIGSLRRFAVAGITPDVWRKINRLKDAHTKFHPTWRDRVPRLALGQRGRIATNYHRK